MLRGLKSRLELERAILEREMPQFQLFGLESERYFLGWHTTRISQLRCQLKLVIPSAYPDAMPSLYVSSPKTLLKHGNLGTINWEGTSHAFHTLQNGLAGCVQICHFKPELWDASKTCVGVLIKGLIWLEAYDAHIVTGRNIADILDEWKRRQRWEEKKIELDELWRIWPGVKI